MTDPKPGISGLQKFSSPKKKLLRRSSLTSSEKTVICNIYKLVEEMWPKDQFLNGKDVATKTAETAGVHVSTVYKVLKEYKKDKQCRSPTPAPKRGTKIDALDDLALGGIRRKIHQYFLNNEPPIVDKHK